jgi:hypothetical protein
MLRANNIWMLAAGPYSSMWAMADGKWWKLRQRRPPPFTIKKKELDLVVETMESVLEKVLGSAHT